MPLTKTTAEDGGRIAPAGGFLVPGASEWPQLLAVVDAYCAELGVHPPFSLPELETAADHVLSRLSLCTDYREFVMVMINNALWRDVVQSVPTSRRTLLLPPCLRLPECPAEFDEYGLMCESCGGCSIGQLLELGESLGYAVLVAESTSVAARLLERGAVDAVIGVSCMPSLARTFEYVNEHCIPCLAFPLLQDGCENTEALLSVITEAVSRQPAKGQLPVLDIRRLRSHVAEWFDRESLRAMLHPHESPVDAISLEWLARDGKRWRPVLAVGLYQALTETQMVQLPEAVRRVGVAMECIHKGSLIYDDIQDDDLTRYGAATVHQVHGTPMAMTCSLQLIGMGYRLICECGAEPAVVQQMLALATGGHVDLCVGQGADVGWLRTPRLLSSSEVLDIFRWKTAPSFEVVFLLGAILAGADQADQERIRAFSLLAGIAYQIRDDLEDWSGNGDVDDIKMGRPCLMTALACEMTKGSDRRLVQDAWLGGDASMAADIRGIISRCGAEKQARELLAAHRDRALQAIRGLGSRTAKIFLHRLVWQMLSA